MNINLKEIRKKLNLSQQEFAEKLNVTQTLISKIEAGKSTPTLKLLDELSKAFQINLSYILFNEGEMFIKDNPTVENINEPEGYYKSKVYTLPKDNEEWQKTINNLLQIIETKNAQINKMLAIIEKLSQNIQ